MCHNTAQTSPIPKIHTCIYLSNGINGIEINMQSQANLWSSALTQPQSGGLSWNNRNTGHQPQHQQTMRMCNENTRIQIHISTLQFYHIALLIQMSIELATSIRLLCSKYRFGSICTNTYGNQNKSHDLNTHTYSCWFPCTMHSHFFMRYTSQYLHKYYPRASQPTFKQDYSLNTLQTNSLGASLLFVRFPYCKGQRVSLIILAVPSSRV